MTKGKVAIVDDEDYDVLVKHKWTTMKRCDGRYWYAYRKMSGRDVYMHRTILGAKDAEETDHINRDGLDNRRLNLRIATPKQNQANKSKQSGTSSKYKGVCWDKKNNKWITSISINNHTVFIGRFRTEEEAAHAYDAKAKELFGVFANLNFPEEAKK